MFDKMDFAKLLTAINQFFVGGTIALVRAFAFAATAAYIAHLDSESRITDVPRELLIVFYIWGLICGLYVVGWLSVQLAARASAWHADVREQNEAADAAITNLDVTTNIQRASLVWLKRRNRQAFQDEWWDDLRDMRSLELLDPWQQLGPNSFRWRVRDGVWNSDQLARWVKEFPAFEGMPWHPDNWSTWR
jgi:hypothetical protein